MIEVFVVPVTPFEQNCALLRCSASGRGAVLDPGGDVERILAAAQRHAVQIEKLLLTHGHCDHAGGAAELAQRLGVGIEGPQEQERFWLDALPQQAASFGLPPSRAVVPDRWLEQGDEVEVGEQRLTVRHTPGHTPGHVVFLHAPSRLALVGDVLFAGSIGRTDFPRGDYATLIRSIREQLLTLDDDVRVFSGHGPVTTIGAERRGNPFLLAPERYGPLG